jgi:hypothetical protein
VFATLKGVAKSADCVEPLKELCAGGVRLRPRALATTLFSRFLLADLFLHGIGGAKYDELSDAIAEDFFGHRPPPFLTLTATFHLPLGRAFENARKDWAGAMRALRDARFNPERVFPDSPAGLIREKQQLVGELSTLKANRRAGGSITRRTIRDVARRLRDVEERMVVSVDRMEPLRHRLLDAERQMAANRILQSREFAAVLYPMAAYDEWIGRIRDEVRGER